MAETLPGGPAGTAPEPVGIVLVSHSDSLARGLRELLMQIGGATLAVAIAGGTDDGRIGTSYGRIADAITGVDKGSGVVVFTDLGSAVLTARSVLADRAAAWAADRAAAAWNADRATDGAADRAAGHPGIVLVDAPFVEGAVAAAVIAGTGADLAAVCAAAEEARDARKL